MVELVNVLYRLNGGGGLTNYNPGLTAPAQTAEGPILRTREGEVNGS
jgi:hypothetical protein